MIGSRVLRIWDHEHLDSVLADYVRCEPHGRSVFEQNQFRIIWSHRAGPWDWDNKQPTAKEDPQYHLVQQAVKKYFREKGRVRVGTFELPPDILPKAWTGEQVAGWLYGAEIKELVRKVTGLVPGRRDGFLAQFMKARKSVYKRLPQEDRDILEGIAQRWEILGPPPYVKKK
ncbi:unnamed protein product [Peniophora sp. CBMAI 1063]|nr:unnamed protein product [Peniophora sp. CBMAI 1063]